MRFLITIILTLSVCFLALPVKAQVVPDVLNYPVFLLDEGGNPLPDGQTKVTVRFLDSTQSVIFEEEQEVLVEEGVAHIRVGEGFKPQTSMSEPTGGISSNLFDPAITTRQRIFVEVEADGYLPQDITEIGSVPYALWSAKAVEVADESIETASIKSGAITRDLLDDELVGAIFEGSIADERLPSSLVRSNDLDTRLSGSNVLGAEQIRVGSTFSNSGSRNVAEILSDFDNRLDALKEVNIEGQREVFEAAIDAEEAARTAAIAVETAARQAADTSERDARQAADTTLQNNINTEASNRASAVSSEASARASVDSSLQSQITSLNTSMPPTSQRTFAWGKVERGGGTAYGNNVSGSSSIFAGGSNFYYQVSFATPASNDNVVVMITAQPSGVGLPGPPVARLAEVNRNGFQVSFMVDNRPAGESVYFPQCAFQWVAFGE